MSVRCCIEAWRAGKVVCPECGHRLREVSMVIPLGDTGEQTPSDILTVAAATAGGSTPITGCAIAFLGTTHGTGGSFQIYLAGTRVHYSYPNKVWCPALIPFDARTVRFEVGTAALTSSFLVRY